MTSSLPPFERYTFTCTADGSRWPYLVQTIGEPQAILINLYGHYSDHYQGMTEGTYNDAFGKLRRACLQRGLAYVTPWYGGNSWMGPLGEAGMVDLIAALRERWAQVPLHLMGGSMGGSSALVFAVRQPQLLSGVAALCPAADVESFYHWALSCAPENPTLRNITDAIRLHYTVGGRDLAEELRNRSAVAHAEALTMPVYLSHGTADALVPVCWTRQLVARPKELGARHTYDELPDGDHDSPIYHIDWHRMLDFLGL